MNRILLFLLLVVAAALPAEDPPAREPIPVATAIDTAIPPPGSVEALTPVTAAPPSSGPSGGNVGGLTIRLDPNLAGPQSMSQAVTILLVITALSMAPAFLMMMTSFTRVIIVLGFLRRALGTQTLPPNSVMLGLALFLTLFIMAPTLKRLQAEAMNPYLANEISHLVALERSKDAMKDFMIRQTRKQDLALFIRLAKEPRPRTVADVSFTTLVPAFITSELKTAFQMGFVIFLPFLVIDLVVSAVLMAMGMMMLPPVVVSLPFKLLLFILVDGWTLLVQGLVASYH